MKLFQREPREYPANHRAEPIGMDTHLNRESRPSDKGTRILKIEATGDFWRGTVKPQIRLKGNWLDKAGFKPGLRVEVRCDQSGSLTLVALQSGEAMP